jgi:glutamate-5-semialdehyde dehydrogenase
MSYLEELGKNAVIAARALAKLGVTKKNEALIAAADNLIKRKEDIIAANEIDIDNAVKSNMSPAMTDRLRLDSKRIEQMAQGIRQVASLDDPVGEVLSMKKRPNGLVIGQKRVPLGVIGIIYESRPNVTADAFALCFKTGNAVILRGGSDAINSNIKIVEVIDEALKESGIDCKAVSLITDTDRELVKQMLKLNAYIDVIIPRGGAGLIKMVVENSTVPVIETGTGNCHIYVDETADFDMAINIIVNAKTQRIGVCNACESVVVHRAIAKDFIPLMAKKLCEKNVEIRGDELSMELAPQIVPATQEDWGKEYLDYILSCRIVNDIDEAIEHINKYNTGHSESIITRDYANSQKFLEEVDAACVYVNASTRFTDGFEFGFGAEIGISTQKLHARGPMGLKELTTTKYIIYGDGQVRG